MTEQQNTPELRFPEFKGEWSKKNLGDEVTFYSGLTYKPDDINFEGTFVLRSSNIKNGKIIDADNVYVDSNKINCTFVNEGDVIVVVRNGSRSLIGKHARVNTKLSNTVIGAFMTGIRCYNSKFINSLLDTNNFYREIHRNLGATINQITTGNFKKMSFYFPSNKEKEKIGEFFGKLDRQIELEEEKLELLEAQKKGYMQKLFSQEMRFKDNKENNYPDWKIVKIGDILEERNERSGEGDMLSVTINHGIIKFDEIDRKDNSSKDKSNYRKVYKDDIAYNSMRMWQGASGKSEYDGIVSPAYTVTIPNESINPDFIAYYFKTHKMIHKFKINSQGLTSDTWNLKYRQLKDIKINLCSKDEQNKIANLLITYDKLINKQKHKLEILKTNKKGFLQKMFV